MSRFQQGDDVLVTFDGQESPGEIIRADKGWVLCTIAVDPDDDYGSITARMSPQSTVCVKETDIRYP